MAIVIDPAESRDRRIKMLLDTVTQAAQIQQNKQELAQRQSQSQQELGLKQKALGYERAKIAQDVFKNRLEQRQMIAGQQNIDRLLSGSLQGQNSPMGVTGATVDPVTGKTSLSIGETQEAKGKRELKQEAAKNLTAFVDAAPKAALALDSVETAAKELGDFPKGFVPQLFAKGDLALKEFGQDEKVANYVGVVGQNLSVLARTIAEEKGPLTDRDIVRIEKGLGNKSAPLKTKLALISELRSKVIDTMTTKLQAAGTSYSDFVKGNPKLAKLLNVGKVQEDANGNRAMVYPDGSFEEIN